MDMDPRKLVKIVVIAVAALIVLSVIFSRLMAPGHDELAAGPTSASLAPGQEQTLQPEVSATPGSSTDASTIEAVTGFDKEPGLTGTMTADQAAALETFGEQAAMAMTQTTPGEDRKARLSALMAPNTPVPANPFGDSASITAKGLNWTQWAGSPDPSKATIVAAVDFDGLATKDGASYYVTGVAKWTLTITGTANSFAVSSASVSL